MDTKDKYPVINEKAIIKIEVSGFFYSMIQAVLMKRCEEVPKEKLIEILTKLKTQAPPSDILEADIHILSILVFEIEKCAKEQDQLEWRDIASFIPPSGN